MPRSPRRLLIGRIDRVALVDKGDNPRADVVIHKRAEPVDKAATKTEAGAEFPAAAYAYVPDAEKPATWKIRLWESPEAKVTAKQVGMAIAALGKGFRGNKADIPADALAGVKAKVRAAWKSVHGKEDTMPDAISKMPTGEGAKTFQQLIEARNATEDLWKYGDALNQSIRLILESDEVDKGGLIETSLEEFMAAMRGLMPAWLKKTREEAMAGADGTTETVEKRIEDMQKRLDEMTTAATAAKSELEAVQKKATESEAEVIKLRIAQRDAEFTKRAAEQYAHVPIKPEVLGPVLRKIADGEKLDEKEQETLGKALAANGQAHRLLEEMGVSGGDAEGSALAKAQAKADEFRKADPKLTPEQALAKVYQEDRGLRRAVEDEESEANRRAARAARR